jgi:hypothetical protein
VRGHSTQQGACQQPTINDPDVAHLDRQAQLVDEIACELRQATPFDIDERAD